MGRRDGANVATSYRWQVAARCLLALVGGVLWVSACGAVISLSLARLGWMSMPEGVHIMTLASFIGWCALGMWIFYAPSLRRVTGLLLGSGGALCILLVVLHTA
ncbi:MAG: hypothetical protein AAF513_04315 [Pseudomonadota bacterium]